MEIWQRGNPRYSLAGKPGSSFLNLAYGKELNWRSSESGASESEGFGFPFLISDNRDLRDLVSVREHVVEVIPVRPFFPSLEIFENGENSRMASTIDVLCGRILDSAEFLAFQYALKSEVDHVVGFALNDDWHGVCTLILEGYANCSG